jgi:hypothetical protein
MVSFMDNGRNPDTARIVALESLASDPEKFEENSIEDGTDWMKQNDKERKRHRGLR